MSEEPKDAEEQLFSDSTVQCDEWQVQRLTQQMTGYYDDVPTVALNLADAPQTEPNAPDHPPLYQPATSAATDPAPPPHPEHSAKPSASATRTASHWLYLVALLGAFGVYLLCAGLW